MIFTYRLPENYPQSLIGVYDKTSGDSPHNLTAFDNADNWKAPQLTFAAPLKKIDAVAITNMPVKVFRRELAEKIKEIAKDELRLIPIKTLANGIATDEFYVVHPSKRISVWDLEASDWEGLKAPDWPPNKPMYMRKMVMKKNGIEPFKIAYNRDWTPMLVFDAEVANLIKQHSKSMTIISPDEFRNA